MRVLPTALRVLTAALRVLTAALTVLLPKVTFAQSPPVAGTIEVAGGLRWTGGLSIGSAIATETTPSESRYSLFAADTTLAASNGLEGSVSVRLSRLVDAGISTSFLKSDLQTHITSDAEGIPDVVASESTTQLAIQSVLAVRLMNWRLGERAIPVVAGGLGYLRHLHEGRTLVETGAVYHVGAGLDYLFKSTDRGLVKTTGLRVDVRAVFRRGAAAFDDEMRVSPALSALLFARF